MNKLVFGLNLARMDNLGFCTLPALMSPSIIGPTDSERKVLVHLEPAIAKGLGIDVHNLPSDTKGAVRLDHSELQARYVGAIIDDPAMLTDIFDMSNSYAIDRSIANVKTVMFGFTRGYAAMNGLIDGIHDVRQEAVVVVVQGYAADIIEEKILDEHAPHTIPRSKVAAFFASDAFEMVYDAVTQRARA